jgi:hypothetical protein
MERYCTDKIYKTAAAAAIWERLFSTNCFQKRSNSPTLMASRIDQKKQR